MSLICARTSINFCRSAEVAIADSPHKMPCPPATAPLLASSSSAAPTVSPVVVSAVLVSSRRRFLAA